MHWPEVRQMMEMKEWKKPTPWPITFKFSLKCRSKWTTSQWSSSRRELVCLCLHIGKETVLRCPGQWKNSLPDQEQKNRRFLFDCRYYRLYCNDVSLIMLREMSSILSLTPRNSLISLSLPNVKSWHSFEERSRWSEQYSFTDSEKQSSFTVSSPF